MSGALIEDLELLCDMTARAAEAGDWESVACYEKARHTLIGRLGDDLDALRAADRLSARIDAAMGAGHAMLLRETSGARDAGCAGNAYARTQAA